MFGLSLPRRKAIKRIGADRRRTERRRNRQQHQLPQSKLPPNGACAKRCARWQLFVTFDKNPAATCLSGRRTVRQAHGFVRRAPRHRTQLIGPTAICGGRLRRNSQTPHQSRADIQAARVAAAWCQSACRRCRVETSARLRSGEDLSG